MTFLSIRCTRYQLQQFLNCKSGSVRQNEKEVDTWYEEKTRGIIKFVYSIIWKDTLSFITQLKKKIQMV